MTRSLSPLNQRKPNLKEDSPRLAFLGFVSRRQRWGLTWRGCLALLILVLSAATVSIRKSHSFLAVNAPAASEYLVIEGWIPEYAVQECAKRYHAGEFTQLITVGGAVSAAGLDAADDDTYAYVAAEHLKQFANAKAVQMVPTRARTRDRTYSSAVSLREWFEQKGAVPKSITVGTVGPHARRTRLLYEKAFGDETQIGIISIPDREYEASRWWRYSEGVKEMVSEGSAYIYARFLFQPDTHKK